MNLNDVTQKIKENKRPNGYTLIAIEGFGGSGKSTIAEKLKLGLGSAYVVCIDDFIVKSKLAESSWDSGVFDRERLKQQVLIPAIAGKDVVYQKLIWETDILSGPIMIPKVSYLIIEGISSYHSDIAKYYDYKIWVDISIETAANRGRARDDSIENALFWDLWVQNDLDYKKKYHPEQRADFVIDNT